MLALAPLAPSSSYAADEYEEQEIQERNVLQKIILEPIEGIIEGTRDSLTATLKSVGMLARKKSSFLNFVVFVGIFFILENKGYLKSKWNGLSFLKGIHEFQNPNNAGFKWELNSLIKIVLAFLITVWLKAYIETLMGRTTRKRTTTTTACVTAARTLLLWLMVSNALKKNSCLKSLNEKLKTWNIFKSIENHKGLVIPFAVFLVIFITAEFLIADHRQEAKEEHGLKTFFKGLVKGGAAMMCSALAIAAMKSEFLKKSKVTNEYNSQPIPNTEDDMMVQDPSLFYYFIRGAMHLAKPSSEKIEGKDDLSSQLINGLTSLYKKSEGMFGKLEKNDQKLVKALLMNGLFSI